MKNQNQKNKLVTLSPQQSNPYTAKPEDFDVSSPDEFLDRYTEGGGQCGENKAEYEKLLAQGNAKRNIGTQGRPTETSEAGKPGDGLGSKSSASAQTATGQRRR